MNSADGPTSLLRSGPAAVFRLRSFNLATLIFSVQAKGHVTMILTTQRQKIVSNFEHGAVRRGCILKVGQVLRVSRAVRRRRAYLLRKRCVSSMTPATETAYLEALSRKLRYTVAASASEFWSLEAGDGTAVPLASPSDR